MFEGASVVTVVAYLNVLFGRLMKKMWELREQCQYIWHPRTGFEPGTSV
jgi:hypothetical protein